MRLLQLTLKLFSNPKQSQPKLSVLDNLDWLKVKLLRICLRTMVELLTIQWTITSLMIRRICKEISSQAVRISTRTTKVLLQVQPNSVVKWITVRHLNQTSVEMLQLGHNSNNNKDCKHLETTNLHNNSTIMAWSLLILYNPNLHSKLYNNNNS